MAKEEFEFYVAGVQYHQILRAINEMTEGDRLILEREPNNKYDINAVRILYDSNLENRTLMLGYVPSKISADVVEFLSKAVDPVCEVIEFYPDAKPWNQLKVKIFDSDENH